MNATWYLVQYTRDLQRQEPRNVGVLLHTDDGWLTRFLGEGEDGSIAGTGLRQLHASVDVYRTWVDYFRRKTAAGAWADVERTMAYRRSNYDVHLGGSVLDDSPSGRQLLDRLFSEVVETESAAQANARERRSNHVLEGAERVLSASGVTPQREVEVSARFRTDGPLTKVPFLYSYVNGQRHLMDLGHHHQRPNLVGADARDLRARMDAAKRTGEADSFVTFYASSLLREQDLDQVLLPFEEVSQAVDVDNEDEAVDTIRTLMGH